MTVVDDRRRRTIDAAEPRFRIIRSYGPRVVRPHFASGWDAGLSVSASRVELESQNDKIPVGRNGGGEFRSQSISFLHGSHQVARKSHKHHLATEDKQKKITGPPRSFTAKSSNPEPSSAHCGCSLLSPTNDFAVRLLRPATPTAARHTKNRSFLTSFLLLHFCNEQLNGVGVSAFFFPADFLYSSPRTVTVVSAPSGSSPFDISFGASANDRFGANCKAMLPERLSRFAPVRSIHLHHLHPAVIRRL